MVEIVAVGKLDELRTDALAVPVFKGGIFGPGGEWAATKSGAGKFLDAAGFTGALGEVVTIPGRGRIGAFVFVGVGEEVDAEVIRQAGGWLAKKTSKMGHVSTTLNQLRVAAGPAALAEGFLLGQYRFDRYRANRQPPATKVLAFVEKKGVAEARRVIPVVEMVKLARDLVQTPAGDKSPAAIAAQVEELAASRRLRLRVYDETEIAGAGFGGLVGVSAGSHRPARMVEIRYEPPTAKAYLALVGKGIVFDSGGLSLKTAEGMETMKTDMSGAATVIAATMAIADLGLPIRVLTVTPLTDNMPGGGAIRPGDVIKHRGGKTSEVLNTDAEGRLVLADALHLAAEAQPDLLVDLATLTGACKTALGLKIAGLWSNDQAAADRVLGAAQFTGERMWQMPLPDDYRKNIESDIADIKNTGGLFAGAINAALFLREFVGDAPWVHIDIAGPARWPDDEHYQTKGGSGFGVRTLVALAEDLSGRR